MSADNFLAIVRGKDGKYRGYHCCASMDYHKISDYRRYGTKHFEVDTREEAIEKAQAEEFLEYGYNFVNDDFKENIDQMRERHKKEIEKLQDNCKHKKLSKWMEFQWAPAHGTGEMVKIVIQ